MNDPSKPPPGGYGAPPGPEAPYGYGAAPDAPAPGYAKERGGCLTALLVLMMIANPLTGIFYLAAGDMVKKGLPNAPDWALPALAVVAFVMTASAIAMFRWKKWGLYGALSCAAIALVINLACGINPIQALMGAAAAPSFLIVLIKPRWHMFT